MPIGIPKWISITLLYKAKPDIQSVRISTIRPNDQQPLGVVLD